MVEIGACIVLTHANLPVDASIPVAAHVVPPSLPLDFKLFVNHGLELLGGHEANLFPVENSLLGVVARKLAAIPALKLLAVLVVLVLVVATITFVNRGNAMCLTMSHSLGCKRDMLVGKNLEQLLHQLKRSLHWLRAQADGESFLSTNGCD